MLTSIISKFAGPALVGFIIGIGSVIGLQHLQPKDEIKIDVANPNEDVLNMINQRLDNLEKTNAINIDKLKNFKGNFTVQQHYSVSVKGDSLLVQKIVDEVGNKMDKLKLSRCK